MSALVEEAYDWELETADLSLEYARLEVTTPHGIAVPVAVVRAADDLLLALPALVTPCLPASLLPLADAETGQPSTSGQVVPVSFFRVSVEGGAALGPSTGGGWTADGAWPAAAGLTTAEVPLEIREEHINHEYDFSQGLPPHPHSLAPGELDAAFLGAVSSGPHSGLLAIRWPPAEPQAEATAAEDQEDEPEAWPDDGELDGEPLEPELPVAGGAPAPLQPGTPPATQANPAQSAQHLPFAHGGGLPPPGGGVMGFLGAGGGGTSASETGVAGSTRQRRAPARRVHPVPNGASAYAATGARPKAAARSSAASLDAAAAGANSSAAEGVGGGGGASRPSGRVTVSGLSSQLRELMEMQTAVLGRLQRLESREVSSRDAGPGSRAWSPLAAQIPAPTSNLSSVMQAAGAPPTRMVPTQPGGGQRPLFSVGTSGALDWWRSPPQAAAPSPQQPQAVFSEGEATRARRAFAQFHHRDVSTVTMDEVTRSPLPAGTWAQLADSRGATASSSTSRPSLQEMLLEQMKATNVLLQQRSGVSGGSLADLANEDIGMGPSPKLPGAKGAAALELLRRELRQHPARFTAAIRRNAREALGGGRDDCTDPRVASLKEYVVRQVPFGKARTSAYFMYGIAEAVDALGRGDAAGAEATLLLLLAAGEQCAVDNGRWSLGWLLTHLPEPPFSALLPAPTPGELRPYGKLSDPAWVASAVAYMKDMAALQELRKKTGKGEGKGDKTDKKEGDS